MPVFRAAQGVEETSKEDIMSDQERAELLERGRERCLNILEKLFEEARQESNLTLTDALWRRFRATRDPEEVP